MSDDFLSKEGHMAETSSPVNADTTENLDELELWRITFLLLDWQSRMQRGSCIPLEPRQTQPGIEKLRTREKDLITTIGETRSLKIRRLCVKAYLAGTVEKVIKRVENASF
jgi:hypothetical protein